MIRDLTKSAMSFSWAVSLLGMKQMVNMVGSGRQSPRDVFAPITQVAVDQLDESMKNIYRSGDNLQANAVDMTFAWLNPGNWMNPSAWLRPFTGGGQRMPGQSNGGCSSNQGGTSFTDVVAGVSQAVNRVATGFTQAVGQASSGMAQAVAGSPRPQSTGSGDASGGSPVEGDSAATGWGPMPGDQ